MGFLRLWVLEVRHNIVHVKFVEHSRVPRMMSLVFRV